MQSFGERPNAQSFLFSTSFDELPYSGKAPKDSFRHRRKVHDAIRGNLADIIGNEDIITSDGTKIIKVPLKTLRLPQIVFDPGGEGGVGQGQGDSQKGQVIGGEQKEGEDKKAGDQPGIDYYESEVKIDDLAAMVFEDLGLPNLEDRGLKDIVSEEVRFNDIRKKGPMGNLDRRRTIIENLRRRAQEGNPTFGGIKEEDLRFRVWEETIKPHTQAAIIAMRDVSGSMGEFEKYISRAFYFWMVRFLRTKYQGVDIRFITHHTEAKEVDENAFFNLGESGGTKVSSAYKLCLDITRKDYQPSEWNVYPFHFSDGDNWGELDNELCIKTIKEGLPLYNMWGYGEIRENYRGNYSTTLMGAMNSLKDEPKVVASIIRDKSEVLPTLRKFFPAEKTLGGK